MCFTLGWLMQFCIQLVVIAAIVAILRLVVPTLVGWIGIPMVGQVINIVLWAVLAIFAIYIIFGLLSCLLGAGHMTAPFYQR